VHESIFANRERAPRFWYSDVVDLMQSIGWEWWLIGVPFMLFCIYILYIVFKTYFIKPGMTLGEKFGALINYISLVFLISIAVDIIRNAAGYSKKMLR